MSTRKPAKKATPKKSAARLSMEKGVASAVKGKGRGNRRVNDNLLNAMQEKFCYYYSSSEYFMNGTQAYIKAYTRDEGGENEYIPSTKVAQSGAYELLCKPEICKRIDELMGELSLNDTVVDRELTKVIHQNADLKAKVAATKEYNALKKRITQTLEVQHSELRQMSDTELARRIQELQGFFNKTD